MAISQIASLPNITSATFNVGMDCSVQDTKSFWVLGTFVATAQVQISPDNLTYVNTGAPVTAPGVVTLPTTTRFARLNVTAYTSGTVQSLIEGQNPE